MSFVTLFQRVIRSYTRVEKIVSIFLIGALLLVCGKILLDKTGLFGFGENAVREGIYTEGFQSNIMRINPVYADLNEPDKDVSRLVFTGITKYDPLTKKIVADMADVTISEDRLTYTFILKDGIMWHDGTPVSSNDVYFTFHDVIQSPDFQNPVLKANFEGVVINRIDEKTVSFVLTSPNSFFITNTTVGLLPYHILKTITVTDLFNYQFNQNPIGTGPYKINKPLSTASNGSTQVILERFDQFYGNIPSILKFRFFGYASKNDLVSNLNSLNGAPKLTDEAIGAVEKNSRFSMYGYSLPQYNAVFFNMNNPILKSLKVRQAMQKAIFKDTFLEQLPNTIRVETPVLSLNQEDYKYTASMDDSKKLLEDAGFNQFYKDTDIIQPESADSAAVAPSETVAEPTAENVQSESTDNTDTATSGETNTDNSPEFRKNAGGTKLEFRLITRLYPEGSYKYNETQKVIDYLKQNWEKAGIKLIIELYDASTLQQKIQTRDYDILLFGQSLGYNLDLYGYYHSTQTTETGLNLSNYKSFKVDMLIEAIRTTFNDDEKNKKLEELAKVIQEDIPAIFLYRPVYFYASDNKAQGINLEGMAFPSDRFCHIDAWSFT